MRPRGAIVAAVRAQNDADLLALAIAALARRRSRSPQRGAAGPRLAACCGRRSMSAIRPPTRTTIGIRGSMPGTGDAGQRMTCGSPSSTAAEAAIGVTSQRGRLAGVSGARLGGSSRARQAGEDFKIAPTPQSYTLRGVVVFQWRAPAPRCPERPINDAGHPSSVGADPPGYSAATCRISRTAAGRS